MDPVRLSSRTSFELEFEFMAGSKIGCILEMDTADFTTSYILLNTADFATSCILKLVLELSRISDTNQRVLRQTFLFVVFHRHDVFQPLHTLFFVSMASIALALLSSVVAMVLYNYI